ncbi:MAG TPA: hypothetical protein VEC58_03880 [Roseiarcus sp.]|nr:hypothetical protein [Roseiarcus sp.]
MLQQITLHLARSPDFPEGSVERGYDIIAPLNELGHLDADAWRTLRSRCRVRRFWQGESDRHGMLVHHAGGARGATWKVDYDGEALDDEETGYRLDTHHFAEGEYVSIRDEDGRSLTFKIAHIRALSGNNRKPSIEKTA